MQFQNTWNSSFDQTFKAESLLENNVSMLSKVSTAGHSQRPVCRKLGGSRMFEVQQLLKLIIDKQYNPRSQLLTMEFLQQHPDTCIKKYRQSIYYGRISGNNREGPGIMLYTNGRIYQGNWFNNYKHGKGYEKFENDAMYQGDYKRGKPEGYGKYAWPNGEYYEGEWLQGMKNGSGIWRGPAGDSYIGQWKDAQANGYGVHTWVNGDRYEGQFKNCLKHGEGIQKFFNGDSYKGMYYQGKPEGNGQYYWSMGSFFKGIFKNGLREGYGVWKSGPGNSDKYEGNYKQDKKQGYGMFIFSNGNMYKGNFLNDLREGYGQMHWNDGKCYKGQWHEGMQVDNPQLNNQMNYVSQQKQDEQQFDTGQEGIQFCDQHGEEGFINSAGVNHNIHQGFTMNQNNNGFYNQRQPRQNNLKMQRNLIASKKFQKNVMNENQYEQSAKKFVGNNWDDSNNFQGQIHNKRQFFEEKPYLYVKKSVKNSPYIMNNPLVESEFYNSPSHPTFLHQQSEAKRFRSRDCSSKKSDRNQSIRNQQLDSGPRNHSAGQFVRNTPGKQCGNNFILETTKNMNSKRHGISRKRLNETEGNSNSVKLRNNASSDSCTRRNIRSQYAAESKGNHHTSDKMMTSSTFFLCKIHGKNGENELNVKTRRAVKTSGGTRQKRVAQDIPYYLNNQARQY